MIVLDEAGAGKTVNLTDRQIERLRKTDLVNISVRGLEKFELKPKRTVGAVHLGDGVAVVVQPKIKIARVLFMLGYATKPGFPEGEVAGVEAADLWPAVAETLCRHATRALEGGVLQGYATEHTGSTVLRGRVRVGDQIARRPGRMMPMEITYDEYSIDTVENRLLRAAVRKMLAVPGVSPKMCDRLRHIGNQLTGVSSLSRGAPLPTWQSHRLNARYEPALRIAELVLRNLSFEAGAGGLPTASFVINMEKVFENFVTVALKEAWKSRPGTTEGQFSTTLDEGKQLSMKPDVVHREGTKTRIVVDAKYKLESASGRYPNSDQYQMLAYCTALNVHHAWLVYARGTQGEVTRNIRCTQITLHEYPLDLDVPPKELLGQIDRLANKAWELTAGN
ncbi:restriction endonuclease [Lentzea tibetensis]|uniref:Restriction endonuclease n=1 Tax=Lentzea tibetensis TaxID=2591470 RepID=A0A563EKP4_9PSEU|nr:restriction endonuclease [Lentzea tibetensis]TWP47514.1 restriction endonuclease [Lentzea tibetensis]